LSYYFSHRVFPIRYEWSRIARIAGLFVGVWIADSLWSPTELAPAIAFKLGALALFFWGLQAFHVIGPTEVQYLASGLQRMGSTARRALGLAPRVTAPKGP
jgi:hypothetical protein